MKIYGVDTDDLSVRQINKLFRKHDESHLWPVCSRFNATERAIRRIRRLCGGDSLDVYLDDYAAALDAEIGIIVNKET